MTNRALHAVMDKGFAWELSEAVLRGKRAAALEGKPAAVPMFGYKRQYERDAAGQPVLIKGRPRILGDVPDALDEQGTAVHGTPAWAVRLIFDRIEAGHTLASVRVELEDLRIPAPRRPRKCTTCGEPMFRKDEPYGCPHGHEQDLCQWAPSAVRFIAQNPGYVGKRIYKAKSWKPADRRAAILDGVETSWPALISEEQFFAVQNILADTGRARWRGPTAPGSGPDRAHLLLNPAARCASCGGGLGKSTAYGHIWYRCRDRGCVAIRADWLEEWAEKRLVSWLVLPEARTGLYAARDDEADIEKARADLERETAGLEETRKLAETGEMSPVMAARAEQGYLARIADAEDRIRPPVTQPILDMLGPDATDRWWKLRTENLPAACQLIAGIASIYVHPAASRGGGVTRGFDESRVEWRWNIGPEASAGPTRQDCSQALAARKQALAGAREQAAKILREDPAMSDAVIGRTVGAAYGTVKRIRAKLIAAGEITDPGYRTGKDGKAYRVVPDARRVTGKARELLDHASPRYSPGRQSTSASNGIVDSRRQARTDARKQARTMLLDNPGMPDTEIYRASGCAYGAVRRLRAALVASGEIPDRRTVAGSTKPV